MRGGLSSKLHISVDELGNPLRFVLTVDQMHDSTQAERLIEHLPGAYLIADKTTIRTTSAPQTRA